MNVKIIKIIRILFYYKESESKIKAILFRIG